MEEPDDGAKSPQPVVFRAEASSGTNDGLPTKDQKKGLLKLSKSRKSTPRPIFKGVGKKRFSFSPSPDLKQAFKKSAYIELDGERSREVRNRRNLLSDLLEVADEAVVPLPHPLEETTHSENTTLDMVIFEPAVETSLLNSPEAPASTKAATFDEVRPTELISAPLVLLTNSPASPQTPPVVGVDVPSAPDFAAAPASSTLEVIVFSQETSNIPESRTNPFPEPVPTALLVKDAPNLDKRDLL